MQVLANSEHVLKSQMKMNLRRMWKMWTMFEVGVFVAVLVSCRVVRHCQVLTTNVVCETATISDKL